jgi:hypothetical protein
MKRLTTIIILMLLSIPMLAWSGEQAIQTADEAAKWKAFSKNLVKAITSENEGLQRSAMRLIITHAENVDVNQAIFDLVHIYRYHKNEKVRQLAVVTIQRLQHNWANGFLVRNLKFEDNENIKNQILANLAVKK